MSKYIVNFKVFDSSLFFKNNKLYFGLLLLFILFSNISYGNSFFKNIFHTLKKEVQTNINQNYHLEEQVNLFASNMALSCSGISGQIDGKVFEDYNYNGLNDVNETNGVENITVTATDSLGNIFTDITDSNGDYSLTGLSNNRTYRVEFTNIPSWASPTFFGMDNGSTIQFLEAGNCANLGIANPADYCETNPLMATPCYVNGDPLAGGSSADGDWLVYFRDDNSGEIGSGGYTPVEQKVTGEIIGSVWGMAYHRQSENVLVGALMKRHSGFGVNGTGAIYKLDLTGTPSLFVDLNTYPNVNTGSDTRGTANNTLPADKTVASRDIDAFQAAGKVGFGDFAISADDQTIFTVNLNEQTLIQMDVGNNLTVPASVDTFDIGGRITNLLAGTPIACGNAADYRPWGLKYYRDLLYIGVVCSAETSQTASDLHTYVLSFDPANPSAGFSLVIDMAMDYAREAAFQSDNPSQTLAGTWRPWGTSFAHTISTPWRGVALPSPILSDIEFDASGAMILGIMDRFGMQSGYRQFSTDLSDPNADYQAIQAGDLIRFCNVGGVLTRENGTTCPFNTSPPWTNPPSDLVYEDEFYAEEEFFTTITNPSHGHPETALGNLAFLPGSGEISTGVYDPFVLRSGGIAWYSNTDGSTNKEYELYESADQGTPDGTLGKAAALGDLEFMCAPAPIEIGNYVWEDTNKNGIQDAGEPGISNVVIELYDNAGNLVASTLTDANGQYFFSDDALDNATWVTANDALNPNTAYYLVAGGGGQFSNNQMPLGGNVYYLTTTNATQGNNSDEIDNDGAIASGIDPDFNGEPYILFTTGDIGAVNHSLDFGFQEGCQLSITDVFSNNCMEQTSNNFTADWNIGFEAIGFADNAISYQRNNDAIQNHTLTGTTDTIIIAGIPADGGVNDILKVWFTNDTACGDTITLKRPLPCPADISPCASTSGCIGGNVFEDFNCNGADDTNEPGVQGIEIQVYDCNNTLVGTGYSDSDGDWQVCGLTDGAAYRIEHILPEAIACWATPTHVGTDNGSDIQFLTPPACTQFSVSNPSDYCQDNPYLSIPCFVNGDPLAGGTAANEDAIVSFLYDDETDNSTPVPPSLKHDAETDEVGAVWGAAFHTSTQQLFTTAFLKRHAGWGPQGIGGIYITDYATVTPTTANFIDLTALGVNLLPSGAPTALLSNGAAGRNLPADKENASNDPIAFDYVGKAGMGAVQFSEDGNTLFIINLAEQNIVTLDISDYFLNGTPPTAGQISTLTIPLPTCANGVARPMALKQYRGKLYVGVTCTGENGGTAADINISVLAYDIANDSWSTVLDTYTMDYVKGPVDQNHPSECNTWSIWTTDDSDYTDLEPAATEIRSCRPVPSLSGIEFDESGNMILGIMDISGHQWSYLNYDKTSTSDRFDWRIGGSILKAADCSNTGVWTIENNGGLCGNAGSANQQNGEGPGGGEFFYEDNMGGNFTVHREVSMGTVMIKKGTNQVVMTAMDPIGIFSGGTMFLNNINGSTDKRSRIYSTGFLNNNGTSGKANGLGVQVAICDPAPLEIGNYVWCDSLQNGIQDACERGINNVLVQLFDRNGILVGQDTTSNSGQYYFNENNVDSTGIMVDGNGISSPTSGSFTGMSYSTQYFIAFGNGQFNAGEFDNGSEMFGISSMANAGSNDNIDSDVDGNNLTAGSLGARPNGLPFIDMTTSATGCGDHKYDMGVTCVPECALRLDYAQTNCMDNGNGTFTATYDLILNWENPPLNSDLTLTHYGEGTLNTTTVAAATIAAGNSTTLSAALTIPADGNGNTGILAAFDTEMTCTDSIGFKAPVPCPADVSPCASTAGCLGGNVFEDFNCNGANDTHEGGVQGVAAEVYDCNNNLVSTGYSDAEGDWQICGLTDGAAYRVEFILPESVSCWATPTHTGSDNQSNVQFLTAPTCTSFSVSNPTDYCNNQPPYFATCFVGGDPINGPNNTEPAGAAAPFNTDNGDMSSLYFKPLISEMGSVWGLAHHASSESIFAASFLKQVTGFGRNNAGNTTTGGIYRVVPDNAGNPVTTLFIDLHDFVDTGDDPHPQVGDVCNSTAFGNNSNACWLHDMGAFGKQGKLSLGDLELSPDGAHLFTVNLFNQSLVKIPLEGNITNPVAGTPEAFDLSIYKNSCSAESDWRPFALGKKAGKMYLGAICSAQSTGNVADLDALIYEFDPSDPTTLSLILQFDLDYERMGVMRNCTPTCLSYWQPWTDNFSDLPFYSRGSNPVSHDATYPMPLLTDIEFFGEEMILGFRDRTADMFGDNAGNPVDFTDNGVYSAVGTGDFLRASKDANGNYILENAGMTGIYTSAEDYHGAASPGDLNTGPGGKEFYSDGSGNHSEISQGGLAQLRGSETLVATSMNPFVSVYSSGGVVSFNNTTGTIERGNAYFGSAQTFDFGKANGMGDVVLLCDAAPLEIGNYVWCDSLQNGIQDACERGIRAVNVSLYDRNGLLVGVTETSTTGQYYFNENNVDTLGVNPDGTTNNTFTGMSYNTQYFIVFGNGQFNAGEFDNGSEMFGISSMANAGSNDNIDSDVDGNNLTAGSLGARPDGLPFIDITTSATGCGDHKYDMGVTCVPECALRLDYAQTNCMDNGNGTFTATYDLILNWENPPSNSDLTLTHYGEGTLNTTTIAAATIAGGNSTTLSTALTVPADGNGNTGILAAFDNDMICKDSIGFKAPVPCPADVSPCASTSGCIGGNVFEDFNCNGTDDTNEPGVQGIQVQIYNCNNILTGTGYTDAEGDWQVCGLNDGESYRVEFLLPEAIACWATPTHTSTSGNQSSVQFLTAPACTQFSVSSPDDYCQNFNPPTTLSCFSVGSLNNTNNVDNLLVFDYQNTGVISGPNSTNYPMPTIQAEKSQIGTTWGTAYDPLREMVYTSAYLKRHMPLGPNGIGAIYQVDVSSGAVVPNAALLVDLLPLLGNMGSITDNTGRGLQDNSDLSHDVAAYQAVGKVGLGDIDIDRTNDVLYAVDLFNKQLVGYNLKTNQIDGLYAIPDPGCTDGDFRPFALEIKKGKIYVGGVCDAANSNNRLDLHTYIYQFDIANKVFEGITFDFPMDYQRGPVNTTRTENDGCTDQEYWQPWQNGLPPICRINTNTTTGTTTHVFLYPQPMLTDIEIDENDNMIIGFADRNAHVIGRGNYSLDESSTTLLYNTQTSGDIHKIIKDSNGNYSFANQIATDCATQSGSGTTYNQEDPDGSLEFFCADGYGTVHLEIGIGALAHIPGTNEVGYISFDPVTSIDEPDSQYGANTGGVRYYNISNGEYNRGYQLYDRFTPGSEGKGVGLGDMEALCDLAPLEIGNYVWCDSLENGIQDACERGINNVLVQLFDRNGILVGQDTTSNSGQYYFNQNNVDSTGITVDGSGIATPASGSFTGMSYSSQYFIVFGNGQFTSDMLNNGSETFGITPMNDAGSNDNIDSDVDGNNLTAGSLGTRPDGLPFIDMTTSATGCGDHKYDFGVTCEPVCSLTNGDLMDIMCHDNNSIGDATDDYLTFTLNPTGLNTGAIYAVSVNSGTITPTTAPYGSPTTFQLQDGSAGAGDVTVTITDAGDAACTLDILIRDPGNCAQNVDFPDYARTGFPPCDDTPCHVIDNDLMFGTTVSADATAMSDSTATTDNDDGITFPNNLRPGTQIRLQIEVTNNTGNDAYVYAWADWNSDGDFDDTGEQLFAATYDNATYSGVYSVSEPIFIPSTATTTNEIAMRFRISSDQTSTNSPCGNGNCSPDGEVEDYLIQLTCPPTICLPPNIQINKD